MTDFNLEKAEAEVPSKNPRLEQVIPDADLLTQMIDEGYVKVREHPEFSYQIYNYTDKCQWDGIWNDVTTRCRGLIIHTPTNEVIARPFPKFFNHNQEQAAGIITQTAHVKVTDKADGSLGILYPLPMGGHAIATRGSFISDQAQHATEIYHERYADQWEPVPGVTYLFEIIYRDNRIVLDYGDTDDLVHLATIDNHTGITLPDSFADGWPGERVKHFPYTSLAQALAAQPRPNAEGLVVYYPETDQRVKIKQDDYVALHRILTGCTARTLWNHIAINWELAAGQTVRQVEQGLRVGPETVARVQAAGTKWIDKFHESTPEEFWTWVDTTIKQLQDDFERTLVDILREYREIKAELGGGSYVEEKDVYRKAFAAKAIQSEHKSALFMLVDDRRIDTYIFRLIYPDHETPFMTVSEDVA